MPDPQRKSDCPIYSDCREAIVQIRILAERLDAAIEISKGLRVDVATIYHDMVNMKVKIALTAGAFGGLVGFVSSLLGKFFT